MVPPSLSVITVNYKSGAFLPRLFASLDAQTVRPSEIVMIDNSPADGCAGLVRSKFPHVRIVDAGGNVGFAVANNIGVRESSGTYIALINSDAYTDPRWLETLTIALDENPTAAVAVGKIYVTSSERVFDQAGALFNNAGNYWGRGHLEQDLGQYDRACEVAGLTACAMMLRRDAIAGEELFDPDFFMYGEELDLTLRLRGRGHTIVYTPDAIAYHEGMGSLAEREDPRLFQQYHANCNRMKILARRYPRMLLLRSFAPLALGFFYWNAFFLLRGGPRFAARALGAQVNAIRRGLAARTARDRQTSSAWIPWMTHQNIQDMLALKRRTHRY